ncbi:MAG: alpha/beta fold hydrolase [Saprospiraceae bacterium]|nr:alpha/beta fold hydrolase [Saprospiraceae bacterium]
MKLNYKIIGQGQPVIILHGLFGMLDNWQLIARKLEERDYMSILIDQRDHGRSPHTDTFNYQVLSDDLFEFMEDNGIHESIILGHSMGGKTAMQFALAHQNSVTKLIVVDMASKAYSGGHEQVFNALLDVNLNSVQSRSEVEEILMNHLNELSTVQFLMKNLSRSKEGQFEWKMNLSLLHTSYPDILAALDIHETVSVETLFIKGERSEYIMEDDKTTLKKQFPNAAFETIADAGHWVHADNPNALIESIIRFIET